MGGVTPGDEMVTGIAENSGGSSLLRLWPGPRWVQMGRGFLSLSLSEKA